MARKDRRHPDRPGPAARPPDPRRREIDATLSTAVALHQQGHVQQAEMLYSAILKLDPRHADALHLAGVAAHQTGRHARAVELMNLAIAVDPRAPHYHFNRGVALQAMNELQAAAAAYREAARLEPDHAQAYENLGVALQDDGDFEAARAAYEKALAIDVRSPIAQQNLGTLLVGLGRTTEARGHFERVLEHQPTHADAHGKRALTLLAEGRYEEGWSEYEWRFLQRTFVAQNPPRVVPFPKWDGFSIGDRTLLITGEQGIGDEIMFASCYPDAIRRARECVIECDRRLVGLFSRSFPRASVIAGNNTKDFAWSDSLPRIDWRVSAGSLPRLFRRRAEDFPQQSAYLRPDARRVAEWRRRLAALPDAVNVGISWRGGREARSSHARSIPLGEWRPVLAASGVNFVNVQYGDHADEIAAFHDAGGGRLHSLEGADALRDVDGFVALLAALDLVISIDNSTVFMAGAVGARVWVLLPSAAEWRWLPTRETSIWFPSVRPFRQAEPGIESWRAVLRSVATRLEAWKHERGGSTRAADGPAQPEASAESPDPGVGSAAAPHGAAAGGRALLVNDTSSWYHWGCSCTSLAIHDRLRAAWSAVESIPITRLNALAESPLTAEEFDDDGVFARYAAANQDVAAAIERASVVYVNGEGTLHGMERGPISLLYLAYVAKRRFGRPVRLINHSCYPDGTSAADGPAQRLYGKVYRELDFVGVRESRSFALLRALGVDATLTFDCLPLFVARYYAETRRGATPAPDRKRIVIGGSVAWKSLNAIPAIRELMVAANAGGYSPTVLVGANAHMAGDDHEFVTELQRSCGGLFSLVAAHSEREWLETIDDASLLISGRFHYSIAAAFLGTPFLVMASNTPKIAGLLEMLKMDTFVSPDANAGGSLWDRAAALLRDPSAALLDDSVKNELLALSEQNFAAAAR